MQTNHARLCLSQTGKFSLSRSSFCHSTRMYCNGSRSKNSNESILHALSTVPSVCATDNESDPSTITTEPSINKTTNDKIQLEMLKILQNIDKKLDTNPLPSNPSNKCKCFQPFQQTDTSKYCWTHGACNHNSKNCHHKNAGHQNEATFENKMGGSTYYCQKE